MNKLARSVAKYNMRKQGYTKFCKNGSDGKSQFSKLWRQFAGMAPTTKKTTAKPKKSFLNRMFNRV